MLVSEVRREQETLNHMIKELIVCFEKSTGTCVEALFLDHDTIEGARITIGIQTKVQL